MFGSTVLDVGIGLIFVYLVFALACSAISEQISQYLGLRANNLWDSLCALLGDRDGTGAAKDLYNHPLVRGLASKQGSDANAEMDHPADRPMPSYIPSDVFSLVIDEMWNSRSKSDLPSDLHKALAPIYAVSNQEVEQARKNIEIWYESAMTRASDWYKRKVQLTIFLVAAILVTATNADSMMIVNKLWSNPTQRTAIVAKAQSSSEGELSSIDSKNTQEVNNLLGWNQCPEETECSEQAAANAKPNEVGGWAMKLFGLLLTAYAAALGAPFWFEILKKLVSAKNSLGNAVDPSKGKSDKAQVSRIGDQSNATTDVADPAKVKIVRSRESRIGGPS